MRKTYLIFVALGSVFCTACFADTDCPSGYVAIPHTVPSSIMAPMLGECETGYRLQDVPSDILPANGFTTDNVTSQITHNQGDCPNGYVDLMVNNATFFKVNISGTCTGGNKYVTEQCKETMSSNPAICGILCDEGLEYTDVGTCAALCPTNHNTLRTSTGLAYPMYATKSVTPSINLGVGESTCYINLISGAEKGAINLNWNNKTYHAVK